jgi:translation initiation factor 6 (eIF-6)
MSNPRIEVDVVANVAGVASGVSTATSELDKLGRAAQSTAPKVDQLGKATSRYNSIGIDFARVIQDAPFGIIGYGNNLQQLAQSFSGLGNVGDSTSTKLKLAISGIFSSGNLLILGVSALTTALTYLTQNGFFKTEKAAESLGERLEQYREKLEGVTKANLEGQIAAQKEISNLKLLQTQAENTSLSQQKRNQAVSELQKQYPEYLKGLTEEQIKTGEVGEAYNKLTNDIVALAKAKALSAELDKQSGDLLTLRLQEEQRANEILQLREKLQVAINNKVDAGARVAGQFTATNSDAMIIQMNIDKLIKEQLKSANDRNKIIKDQLFIESQIVEQSSLGANFVKQTGKGIDENKDKLEKYSAAWDEYNFQQEIAREFQDKLTESTKGYQQEIDKVAKAIGDVQKFGKEVSVKIKTEVEGFEDEKAEPRPYEVFLDDVAYQINKKIPPLEQRMAEFANTINDLLKNNVTDAFIDLGYTIGETLASGGNVLKAIGGSLLKS